MKYSQDQDTQLERLRSPINQPLSPTHQLPSSPLLSTQQPTSPLLFNQSQQQPQLQQMQVIPRERVIFNDSNESSLKRSTSPISNNYVSNGNLAYYQSLSTNSNTFNQNANQYNSEPPRNTTNSYSSSNQYQPSTGYSNRAAEVNSPTIIGAPLDTVNTYYLKNISNSNNRSPQLKNSYYSNSNTNVDRSTPLTQSQDTQAPSYSYPNSYNSGYTSNSNFQSGVQPTQTYMDRNQSYDPQASRSPNNGYQSNQIYNYGGYAPQLNVLAPQSYASSGYNTGEVNAQVTPNMLKQSMDLNGLDQRIQDAIKRSQENIAKFSR